jgi:hypothetical protein
VSRAILAAFVLLGGGAAVADPIPYKMFWSFPSDDVTAIEVDDADLSLSPWEDMLW